MNSKRIPPSCLSLKLTTEYIGISDATKKAQMEACLEETKSWLDPLHQRYILCKNATTVHQNKTVECNLEQGTFEESFCAYESRIEGTCAEQTSCRTRTVEARNETHKAVAVAEAARKTDVEGGLRILCLFDVFEANNTDKPNTLSTCLNKTYNTSKYDITYHPVPAAVSCTKDVDAPCDDYASQAWYSKAPTTMCKVCPAHALGTTTPAPAPTTNWLGTTFSANIVPMSGSGSCGHKNWHHGGTDPMEWWNLNGCPSSGWTATIDFGVPMTIDGHYWMTWVDREIILKQKVQYSTDGTTWTDANSLQTYTQADIDTMPAGTPAPAYAPRGTHIVTMSFPAQTAQYWRWYVGEHYYSTVQKWEFRGTTAR